jgi:hypothetical protein
MLQGASTPDDMRWLPGARLNIAESALCVRDPDAPALLWADEGAPDVVRSMTLGELRLRAQHFAAALAAAGHSPGAIPHSLSPPCIYLHKIGPWCLVQYILKVLDDEERAPIYYTNALVYLLPWLSRGFELDSFSVGC